MFLLVVEILRTLFPKVFHDLNFHRVAAIYLFLSPSGSRLVIIYRAPAVHNRSKYTKDLTAKAIYAPKKVVAVKRHNTVQNVIITHLTSFQYD